ncbi:MAG TPA: NADH-quinone oxidoreductase subunit NuoE [Acidobacteriota bacterium]|nr:NADH-quinone oxidoreductase subunit NuoE [Acidobacteriota bacterium]
MLSEKTHQKIKELIAKYPHRRSALIPSLQLAQDDSGYLTPEAVRDVAAVFELSPNEVYEVASFYTMLHKKPVGRYLIQVCTNISCLLCGSENMMTYLENKLGIKPGETTPDNKFTLMEVECLASCGTAPVVQINDDYHEDLTPERLERILSDLS